MTTKRELERLAREAFGTGSNIYEFNVGKNIHAYSRVEREIRVEVADASKGSARDVLSAALRGIIAWKEARE